MADYIKKIRTSDGDKQIDYTALANLPGNATASAAGLMSPADKSKLDGISSGADSVSFTQSLTSGTKIGTLTINGTGTDLYCSTNTATGILPVDKGGTGANNAAGARANLSVPEVQNRVIITANQGGIGTGIHANEYWQFWNVQDGDAYPVALCPSSNGRQSLGWSNYHIKSVYANDYPCGTWNGNAIAVNKGGTGATDAAGARQNLGITPQNIGAMPTTGGPFTGPVSFNGSTIGLVWTTANGTMFSVRPYTAGNIFQITTQGPDTENAEQPSFNITSGGHLELNHALGVTSGGTGAKDALSAAVNLGWSDPDVLDISATDVSDWTAQIQAHILERVQDRRCMTFTAGWSGRGFGSGIAWKTINNVYVLIYNMEALASLRFWYYSNNNSAWTEVPIGTLDSLNGVSLNTSQTITGYKEFTGGAAFAEETLFRKRIYVDKSDGVSVTMSTGNSPKMASMYLSINGTWTNALTLYEDKSTLTKPLDVASGGTGANSAAGARANLGIGVADTASGTINYTKEGQQVNFGKTLSKAPVVFCAQNGGTFAYYRVGNITQTGFTITASETGTTWRYVALCV